MFADWKVYAAGISVIAFIIHAIKTLQHSICGRRKCVQQLRDSYRQIVIFLSLHYFH